jgi:hypothetical protein
MSHSQLSAPLNLGLLGLHEVAERAGARTAQAGYRWQR